MTPAEISALVGLGLLSIAVGGVIFRLGVLSTKVDTMWEFQMRRGLSEGVSKGVMTVNSPVQVTEEAMSWMHGMAEELGKFYARLGRRMTEADLALEIERRYGDRILHEVCIPKGLSQGACLIIAMEVAKKIVVNGTA